jgi:hypothetical protein
VWPVAALVPAVLEYSAAAVAERPAELESAAEAESEFAAGPEQKQARRVPT